MKEMKLIYQTGESDCGAACLAMIANFYGFNNSISFFREITSTNKNGTTMLDIVDAAEKIGLKAEGLSGCFGELIKSLNNREINVPFIFHTINEDGFEHFSIVYDFDQKHFYIADPGKGKLKISVDMFEEIYTGSVISISLDRSFKKNKYKKKSSQFIKDILRKNLKKISISLIMSIIVAIIGMMGTFVFQVLTYQISDSEENIVCEYEEHNEHSEHDEITYKEYIDNNTEYEPTVIDPIISKLDLWFRNLTNLMNTSNISTIFILLIVVYIISCVVQYLRGRIIIYLSRSIDSSLGSKYFEHIFRAELKELSNRQTGEYISRFSDMDSIRDAVSNGMVTLMLDALMILGSGVILYMQNRIMFFVSMISVALYVIIAVVFYKPIEKKQRNVMTKNASVESFLKETVDGMETIKSNTAISYFKDKMLHKYNGLLNSVVKSEKITILQQALCGTVETIGMTILLWIGFILADKSVITLGALLTFYSLAKYFLEPIKNVLALQPLLQNSVVAIDRLNDIYELEEETDNPVVCERIEEIKFDNVKFGFGSDNNVLNGISFNLPAGEKIAFVGECGCGKTTLARLLLKYYKAQDGKITWNGEDICNINTQDLRSKISYVSQNPSLFAGSIKDNITMGDKNISEKDIMEVVEKTCAFDFVKTLPLGLEYIIEENGSDLSSGQRQKIALIRALVRKPEILILDEATSNLDIDSEMEIKNMLFTQYSELTMIVIAHKSQLIKGCNTINLIKNGKIVDSGIHENLAHNY